MYKGYNLKISGNEPMARSDFDLGKELYSKDKKIIEGILNGFLKPDGAIDATKMQSNWFPQIQADVFISHSHQDEKLAYYLAGWLKSEFNLKAFIDSYVWGYSDKLLKIIDDSYCYNAHKNTYVYEKRNLSTSHVHMMLSTALSMMIDNTECVFFLNTPNSVTPGDTINGIDGVTRSPWIYLEISMTKLIQKKSRDEHRGLMKKALAKSMNERMEFQYNVSLNHLIDIGIHDLNAWHDQRNTYNYKLDGLYNLK